MKKAEEVIILSERENNVLILVCNIQTIKLPVSLV